MILESTKQSTSFVAGKEDKLEGNFLEGGISTIPFREVNFDKGENIYRENEPSSCIYLIISGSVKVARSSDQGIEIVKSIIGVGDIFGEKAISGEESRLEYAQAINSDTIVQVYNVKDVLQAARQDDVLCINLFRILGNKVVSLERRLDSIISKDSRTRIVDFLREMANDNGKKVGFETMIKNNFTHKDIASLTGTSRQTVTTTLNSLKEQNIINFDRRRILIRDMDLLV